MNGKRFVTDQSDGTIQHVVIGLRGKGIVRYHAVPIFRFVLGEGATHDLGMFNAQTLHVRLIQLYQGNHLAAVRFVHVSKAHALAQGGESKMVIRKQKLSVGSAVCSAIQFHSVFVLCRKVGNDGLFADQALSAGSTCHFQTFRQGALFFGNHHGSKGLLFQLADLFLQSGDLAILFLQFFTSLAIGRLRRLGLHISRFLGKHRQANQGIHAQREDNTEDHVNRNQRTDPNR